MALDGSRAEYYRSRAQIIRQKAAECLDENIKRNYELIAEQYDQLARQVETNTITR